MNITQVFERCTYTQDSIPMAPHFHENVELIYVKNGQAALNLEDNEYSLENGSLAFIHASKTHKMSRANNSYQRFYLLFSAGAFKQEASGEPMLQVMLEQLLQSGQALYFPESKYAQHIESCFHTILQEHAHCGSFSMDMAMASLKQILIVLYRALSDATPISVSLSPEVSAVKTKIEQNLADDVRISELAAENYISPCYLSHQFKEQIGVSPKSYLLICRLKQAKELLVGTDLPIAQVAFRCGFKDVNNFIRNFKNDTGETPKRYRIQCRSQLS